MNLASKILSKRNKTQLQEDVVKGRMHLNLPQAMSQVLVQDSPQLPTGPDMGYVQENTPAP
jgi:hypothetical protein